MNEAQKDESVDGGFDFIDLDLVIDSNIQAEGREQLVMD